jgi:hypothetical protein
MDWSNCPDVERIQGKVSGQWIVKDTRILVQGVIDNGDDGFTQGNRVNEQRLNAKTPRRQDAKTYHDRKGLPELSAS